MLMRYLTQHINIAKPHLRSSAAALRSRLHIGHKDARYPFEQLGQRERAMQTGRHQEVLTVRCPNQLVDAIGGIANVVGRIA